MACTIDATVGSPTANSYITIADAQTYLDSRLRTTAWDNATDDDRCRALRTATRAIDQYVDWDGAPVTFEQPLAWPRYGMTTRNGDVLDPTVLPTDLTYATAEMALRLLERDSLTRSQAAAEGLTALAAGPVSLSFKNSIPMEVIPESVRQYLAPFGTVRSGPSMTVPLVRV